MEVDLKELVFLPDVERAETLYSMTYLSSDTLVRTMFFHWQTFYIVKTPGARDGMHEADRSRIPNKC